VAVTRISRILPLLPFVLAGANLIWQLDSPSLYIDEAFSWFAAEPPFGELLHRVRTLEVAPWGYYVGLHGWLGLLGSDDEWVMRLPSVAAALALVAVTFRIGVLVVGRRPALLAAVLIATSPLILTYGQQVRSYVFAMLLAAVAVWAALEAEHAGGQRRRRRWLLLLVASSIAAVWMHYTAALVLIPLLAWVVLAGRFARRTALALVGSVALGSLPVLYLMLDQRSRGHETGVARIGHLTAQNALQVIGTPFDGRSERLTPWLVLGVIALALATASLVLTGKEQERRRLWSLLFALASTPILAVIVQTAVSADVLISRYTATAAPFLVLLIAAGVSVAPRPLGAVAAVVAVVGAVGASFDLHRQTNFYADVRGAFEAIEGGYRKGDVIVVEGYTATPIAEYYRRRELPQVRGVLAPELFPEHRLWLRHAVDQRRRIWWVDQPRPRPAFLRRLPAGYRPAKIVRLTGIYHLQTALVVPARRRAQDRAAVPR
jgi:4-amino-4-deoxy-L-arabinose transferase-like glycosyltransferase